MVGDTADKEAKEAPGSDGQGTWQGTEALLAVGSQDVGTAIACTVYAVGPVGSASKAVFRDFGRSREGRNGAGVCRM